MALTLLRHPPPDVAPGICYGRTDLDLSPDADMTAIIADLPAFGALITSPLRRCRQLGDAIAAATGARLEVEPLWQEMDFGRWEMTAWEAIPRPELDAWAADFSSYDGHGGEPVASLEARVKRALRVAPRDALVVTHMGCIKAALALRGDRDGWEAQVPFGARVTL